MEEAFGQQLNLKFAKSFLILVRFNCARRAWRSSKRTRRTVKSGPTTKTVSTQTTTTNRMSNLKTTLPSRYGQWYVQACYFLQHDYMYLVMFQVFTSQVLGFWRSLYIFIIFESWSLVIYYSKINFLNGLYYMWWQIKHQGGKFKSFIVKKKETIYQLSVCS